MEQIGGNAKTGAENYEAMTDSLSPILFEKFPKIRFKKEDFLQDRLRFYKGENPRLSGTFTLFNSSNRRAILRVSPIFQFLPIRIFLGS